MHKFELFSMCFVEYLQEIEKMCKNMWENGEKHLKLKEVFFLF